MKKITSILAIFGTALILAPLANAGGYHCQLKINDFKVVADKTYELKVEKVAPDRALYVKQLGEWEMVNEPIGKQLTLVFKVTELDESALTCLNWIIHSFKNNKEVEFGFGETAIKADEDGKYISTMLETWHTNKKGEPCVHGS